MNSVHKDGCFSVLKKRSFASKTVHFWVQVRKPVVLNYAFWHSGICNNIYSPTIAEEDTSILALKKTFIDDRICMMDGSLP